MKRRDSLRGDFIIAALMTAIPSLMTIPMGGDPFYVGTLGALAALASAAMALILDMLGGLRRGGER